MKPILNNIRGTNCTFFPWTRVSVLKHLLKKFGRCYENTDKGQEHQEVYIFLIKCEDQVGSNAETGVARVGSEPADTTNDMIGL